MNMRHLLFAALVTLGCTACTSTYVQPQLSNHAESDAITIEDGLDANEAEIIVRDYLNQHNSCSDCYDGPRDAGYAWVYRAMKDTGALPLEEVSLLVVNKQTGDVLWLGEE